MNKVEKIKKLADAMYNRMQNLTTDTSGIRKAMDEYHQFIINEYYKEDTEKDFGIKESVIPFGASDGELMEETIYIPQGYHAVIDGNKVIIKKGEDPVGENTQFAQMADKYEQQVLIGEYQMKESIAHHCRLSYYLGLKDGAQWKKEKMMEDAVDGEIYFSMDYLQYHINTEPLAHFHHGDKVKLIIVKEE